MKICLLNIKVTFLSTLIIACVLLTSCAAQKRVMKLDEVQTQYNNAVLLNERYLHGLYGEPDPASFTRLTRYRYEAYQAIMQFRSQFDKTKPISKVDLSNANQKIDIYTSYLNALGATSATKNTLTGF